MVRSGQRGRLADAVEAGLDLGKGIVHVVRVDESREEPDWRVERFSQHLVCEQCQKMIEFHNIRMQPTAVPNELARPLFSASYDCAVRSLEDMRS